MEKQVVYDTDKILYVINNLSTLVESINYCFKTNDERLFYIYLGKYCDYVVKHYDLIKTNFLLLKDFLIFDFSLGVHLQELINEEI